MTKPEKGPIRGEMRGFMTRVKKVKSLVGITQPVTFTDMFEVWSSVEK